jgi:predicted nuclease of predicted toxin-antitoxin system
VCALICLIDQNLPPALAVWLRERGTEALHVGDIGLADRGDADVLAVARDKDYIIITKDGDYAFAGPPPVVWVRLGNVTRARLLAVFDATWTATREALDSGETLVEIT